MDEDSNVWTFTSWGRPFRLASSRVDKSSPETTPVQVESGWHFSAILTASGDLLFYWPFSRKILRITTEMDADLESSGDEGKKEAAKARPTADGVIPCYHWVLDADGTDPVRLPRIPATLPDLVHTGLSKEALSQETKLVKIAGLSDSIIGLTNKGHVLRYLLNPTGAYQAGHWRYVCRMCPSI